MGKSDVAIKLTRTLLVLPVNEVVENRWRLIWNDKISNKSTVEPFLSQ